MQNPGINAIGTLYDTGLPQGHGTAYAFKNSLHDHPPATHYPARVQTWRRRRDAADLALRQCHEAEADSTSGQTSTYLHFEVQFLQPIEDSRTSSEETTY